MKAVKFVFAFLLVAAMAASVSAQEKQGGQGKKGRGQGRGGYGGNVFDRFDSVAKDLNLTDDQKAKYEAIKKEFAPKMEEFQKKRDAILTDAQRKTRDEAAKAATDAGKSAQEARQAGMEAYRSTITDDQRKQMNALFGEMGKMGDEIRSKIDSLLTEEQKAKMPSRRGNRQKKQA